jgi:hypothetical protein
VEKAAERVGMDKKLTTLAERLINVEAVRTAGSQKKSEL